MEEINKKLINLDLEAENWEEAIEKGGEILINEGYIDKKYIESLLKISKREGPYYIITKGIALPHVRPDEGVRKNGFSFVRLRKPLNFGNKENDPVKYMIFLMALDSEKHISLIRFITKVVEDGKIFELAEKCKGNTGKNINIIHRYLINFENIGDDSDEKRTGCL
ncbi:MAG: PTS sugar transporter subunit IIA [Leptotrichiaceae bacterium]|nr:PTS sugar transporter subunit IIA [Leptotrichiaceae bacterium]